MLLQEVNAIIVVFWNFILYLYYISGSQFRSLPIHLLNITRVGLYCHLCVTVDILIILLYTIIHSGNHLYTVSEKLKKIEIRHRVKNMMSANILFTTGGK